MYLYSVEELTCKASLVIMNSFTLDLSGNMLSLSYWRQPWQMYTYKLMGYFFSFCPLNMSSFWFPGSGFLMRNWLIINFEISSCKSSHFSGCFKECTIVFGSYTSVILTSGYTVYIMVNTFYLSYYVFIHICKVSTIITLILLSCFLKINLFYFMSMDIYLHVCMCANCWLGTCRNKKNVLDPLELQVVMGHHVGVGNWIQVHCKNKRS